jgi:hypothetical protein
MKIDPYKHEERYKKWLEKVKAKGIEGISKENSEIVLQYVTDMEHGLNVSSKNFRGGRSFIRLNTIKEKMIYFSKKFKEIYGLERVIDMSEDQLVLFFSKMQKGDITRQDGKRYLSTNYFVKVFKAFWHWHQTVNRKNEITLPDITIDLDTRREKPKWVYLTEE